MDSFVGFQGRLGEVFIDVFNRIQSQVHANAVKHGFLAKPINDESELSLIISEVREAQEALRNGNPESPNIPGFSCGEEELADMMMRGMSYAEGKGWDVAGAIVAKHEFNKSRPYKHGKEF
jgi:NTP pyrophosphatase (non-canonical NTP hydrolase)